MIQDSLGTNVPQPPKRIQTTYQNLPKSRNLPKIMTCICNGNYHTTVHVGTSCVVKNPLRKDTTKPSDNMPSKTTQCPNLIPYAPLLDPISFRFSSFVALDAKRGPKMPSNTI